MKETLTQARSAELERAIRSDADPRKFVTAATGELSRSWSGHAPGAAAGALAAACSPAAAPPAAAWSPAAGSRLVPLRPAVPLIGERPVGVERSSDGLLQGRPPRREIGAPGTETRAFVRRRRSVIALFLAALAVCAVLAGASFWAAPRDSAPAPTPSPQATRTSLSREAHGRLFAASSAANGGGQDWRKGQPEAVP